MRKQTVSEIVVNLFNGNIEAEPKFVEVDGKKYQSNDGKEPVKDDKGVPVPFVEKKQDDITLDVAAADLEALAKVNPLVAKLLSDSAEAKKIADQSKKDEEERQRLDSEKKGEWQKLADSERIKREEAERVILQKDEQLGKYKGSVETILKEVLATIPKERQALIPADYSSRQKLEYIIANAKALGAVILGGKGGKIDPSDNTPSGTEEDVLVKEVDELTKKGAARTSYENTLFWEKSKKLKELRQKKEADKK